MKSNNKLNIDMSINFFEDLVVMLKELKEHRAKEDFNKSESTTENKKHLKI